LIRAKRHRERQSQLAAHYQGPILDGNGEVTGIAGVGHDITARKKAELEWQRAKEAAEMALSLAQLAFLERCRSRSSCLCSGGLLLARHRTGPLLGLLVVLSTHWAQPHPQTVDALPFPFHNDK
jgi:PAS domain-containing protein